MNLNYDYWNRIKPCEIYLARSNKRILGALNGLARADFTPRMCEPSSIEIELTKYENGELTNFYEEIDSFMELFIPEFGWFYIEEPPHIQKDAMVETKSFTAMSYEYTLKNDDLVGFKVNCGTTGSLEMYKENLDVDGIPKEQIILYNPSNPKLSLIDLVLHDVNRSWKPGHIDTSLTSLQRSFDEDSTDILSFFQKMSKAFGCIFQFDSANMLINAYDVHTYGKDTSICLTYDTILNNCSVQSDSDEVYTVFTVEGDDGLNINPYNLGSADLININYFLHRQFSPEVIDKYNSYLKARESLCSQYLIPYKEYTDALEHQSEIKNRVPEDAVNNNWAAYDLSDLTTELAIYEKLVIKIEDRNKKPDGSLDMTNSPDLGMYLSFKNVIIPDIKAEISRKETGTVEDAKKVDYETMWNLYGVTELKNKISSYELLIESYQKNGYDKPWPGGTGTGTEALWKSRQGTYKKYQNYLKQAQEALEERQNQFDSWQNIMNKCQRKMDDLARQGQPEFPDYGFDNEELSSIKALYRHTDYSDTYITLSDFDGLEGKLTKQKELLQSAIDQLEIESQPQLQFSISTDSPFYMEEFSHIREELNIGNFIYVETAPRYYEKARISEMTFSILRWDQDLDIKFSTVTTSYGKRSDFLNLVDKISGSGKNSIKAAATNATDASIQKFLRTVFSRYTGENSLNSQINGINSDTLRQFANIETNYLQTKELAAEIAKVGNLEADSAFIQYLTTQFITSDSAAFQNLIAEIAKFKDVITDYLKVKDLAAEIAKIGVLDADSAFIRCLAAQFISADSADFQNLASDIAKFKAMVAGNISVEDGYVFNFTAKNTHIDKAFIREFIASQITALVLTSAKITANDLCIQTSEGNTGLKIVGNTLQLFDSLGNIGIQLGYDKQGHPSLILTDSSGNIMLDSTGLHDAIVPEKFIKSDMVGDNEIKQENIDTTGIREWKDENGKTIFDISKMKYNDTEFSVSYESYRSEVAQLSSMVDSIELIGNQVFTQDSSGKITPSSITVKANTKNNAVVGKWLIDDEVTTDGVSDDKLSITIPYTAISNKKSILLRAQTASGNIYDDFTLYRVVDGADAINVFFSNENHTFAASDSGVTTPTVISLSVFGYRGSRPMNTLVGEISDIPAGMTVTVENNNTKVTSITIAVSSALAEYSGTLAIPVTVDGVSITKNFAWNKICHGQSAINILCTNESDVLPADENGYILSPTTLTTTFAAYKGTSQIPCTVTLPSPPSGMTITQSNDGLTVIVTMHIEQKASLGSASLLSGHLNYKINANEQNFNKQFSWTKSPSGSQARTVNLTASSQVFKSIDGGKNFTPELITLTPYFHGTSYSKWQVSADGGVSWADITNGTHGLSLIDGVLKVSKDCDLFKETVTTLSFKIMTNINKVEDVISILKLSDLTNIEIAGNNLLENSDKPITSTQYLIQEYYTSQDLLPGKSYTLIINGSVNQGNLVKLYFDINNEVCSIPFNKEPSTFALTFTAPPVITTLRALRFCNAPETSAVTATINWVCLYAGHVKAPSEYMPNYEVLNTTLRGVESLVDKHENAISNKVWQQDEYVIQGPDGTDVKINMHELLVQQQLSLTGITSTVKDHTSTLNTTTNKIGKENDPPGDNTIYSKISKAQQTADKIEWIVSSSTGESNMTLTPEFLAIAAKNIKLDGSVIVNGVIKSKNYKYESGSYAVSGTCIDLTSGILRSKNFSIDSSGNAYFKGTGEFSGKINAQSGSFTGKITASSGTIGGFAINSASIATSGTTTIGTKANSVYIGTNGISCGTDFKVTNVGALTANNASISGNITASSITASSNYKIFINSTQNSTVIISAPKLDASTKALRIGFEADNNGRNALICIDKNSTQTKISLYADEITLSDSLYVSGGIDTTGNITTEKSILAKKGITTSSGSGWTDTTYAGGWYMTDTTWIRAKNNKSVYTGGTLQSGYINSTGDLRAAKTITGGTINSTGDMHASGIFSSGRLCTGWDSGDNGSVSCSNWFRSVNATGLYCSSYGGGIYMNDSTWVRAYNNKSFAAYDLSSRDLNASGWIYLNGGRLLGGGTLTLSAVNNPAWGDLIINNAGQFYPTKMGGYSLGQGDGTKNRWYGIYLQRSPDVSSLYELKTNIEKLSTARDEIMKTDVCSYNLTCDLEKDIYKKSYGFIIGGGYSISEKFISVSGCGIDGYNIDAFLCKGLQELYLETDTLEDKLSLALTRIQRLEEQLNNI